LRLDPPAPATYRLDPPVDLPLPVSTGRISFDLPLDTPVFGDETGDESNG